MTSQPRPLQLSAPENNGHFFWLDWLRFGAAFLVLLCHTRDVTWVDWAELAPGSHTAAAAVLFALSRLGYEAVIIFFVLSGFFVGGKTVQRLLLGTFHLSDYALDRLTRIYLPLLPALLLSATVGWIVARPIPWPDLLGACFGLQGIFSGIPSTNAPLWSLADEMWFYLALLFLGLAWASTRWNKILGICGLLFCFAAFARLGFLYFTCWSLGAALYFIPHRFFSCPSASSSPVWAWPSAKSLRKAFPSPCPPGPPLCRARPVPP